MDTFSLQKNGLFQQKRSKLLSCDVYTFNFEQRIVNTLVTH